MKIVRVLIVDDSRFMRRRVAELFADQKDLEVIGEASTGREAIRKVAELEPDVVTMDIEMPVMDGISAVKQIMQYTPTPVMMFSIATQQGAQATLDALDAGAMDFFPKQLEEVDNDAETAKRLFCSRVRALGWQAARIRRNHKTENVIRSSRLPNHKVRSHAKFRENDYSLLVIAASTGGPVAIQKILSSFPANYPVPVLLVQHMPGDFTCSFAQRLDGLSAIRVKEAENGDILQRGVALLAPGGYQLELVNTSAADRISIRESQEDEYFHPCVDVVFRSIASHFRKKVLAVVLTGMGSDGTAGAQELKDCGASIWAQDEESCTVYGMPKAIVDAKLADRVLNLDDLAKNLATL